MKPVINFGETSSNDPQGIYFANAAGTGCIPFLLERTNRRWITAHPMAYYRAYILSHNDRIQRGIDIECPDDTAAIEEAKKYVKRHDVELWQLDRMVAVLQPVNGKTTKPAPGTVRDKTFGILK